MDGLFRRGFARRVTVAVVALGALTATVAFGATPASDVAISRFATDFASAHGIGPTGIAFDGAGDLFVVDRGTLYRFGAGGGPASAHVLTSSSVRLAGIAFSRSGQLFAARWVSGNTGDVVQLDPGDGTVVRTVVSNLKCPAGVAVDPLSGDLFVSETYCGKKVLRVIDGVATPYFTGLDVDGIAFGRDGTLYMAHEPDTDGNTVSTLSGTDSTPPPTRKGIAALNGADGIALAADDSASGGPAFLVVNRRDGAITRVELNGSHATRDLVTGGTRGDFVAAGPDGCLYATQTDEILKVTNPGGSCRDDDVIPPTGTGTGNGTGSGTAGSSGGGLGSGLAPTSIASASSACPANRQLIVRYNPRWKFPTHHARVIRARIFTKGHYNRTVSGRALRRRRGVIVRRLPALPFRLTIRVFTRRHNHVAVRRRYGRCAGTVYKPKH